MRDTCVPQRFLLSFLSFSPLTPQVLKSTRRFHYTCLWSRNIQPSSARHALTFSDQVVPFTFSTAPSCQFHLRGESMDKSGRQDSSRWDLTPINNCQVWRSSSVKDSRLKKDDILIVIYPHRCHGSFINVNNLLKSFMWSANEIWKLFMSVSIKQEVP